MTGETVNIEAAAGDFLSAVDKLTEAGLACESAQARVQGVLLRLFDVPVPQTPPVSVSVEADEPPCRFPFDILLNCREEEGRGRRRVKVAAEGGMLEIALPDSTIIITARSTPLRALVAAALVHHHLLQQGIDILSLLEEKLGRPGLFEELRITFGLVLSMILPALGEG